MRRSSAMKTGLFYFLCVLALGVTPLFEKLALRSAPSWVVICVRGLFVGILYAAGAAVFAHWRDVGQVRPVSFGWIIVSGLVGPTVGMYLYFELLRSQPTAKVVALTATYPVFTALLATFVLKEPFHPVQFLGILLTVAGVTLVMR